MSRYIDADLFREKMVKFIAQEEEKAFQFDDYDVGWIAGLEYAKDELYNAPTADVQEVKHGRWITEDKGHYFYDWKCSVCGGSGRSDYLFCHICGAKMVNEDE